MRLAATARTLLMWVHANWLPLEFPMLAPLEPSTGVRELRRDGSGFAGQCRNILAA